MNWLGQPWNNGKGFPKSANHQNKMVLSGLSGGSLIHFQKITAVAFDFPPKFPEYSATW